jgi:hypothetical protein
MKNACIVELNEATQHITEFKKHRWRSCEILRGVQMFDAKQTCRGVAPRPQKTNFYIKALIKFFFIIIIT